MGFISTNIALCGKKKELTEIQSDLAKEVFMTLNLPDNKSKENFIAELKDEVKPLYVFQDDEEDGFVAFTEFGNGYFGSERNDIYYTMTFPKPSEIPDEIIMGMITDEDAKGIDKDWNVLAALCHFNALTDREKDAEGFPFYGWLWQMKDEIQEFDYKFEVL